MDYELQHDGKAADDDSIKDPFRKSWRSDICEGRRPTLPPEIYRHACTGNCQKRGRYRLVDDDIPESAWERIHRGHIVQPFGFDQEASGRQARRGRDWTWREVMVSYSECTARTTMGLESVTNAWKSASIIADGPWITFINDDVTTRYDILDVILDRSVQQRCWHDETQRPRRNSGGQCGEETEESRLIKCELTNKSFWMISTLCESCMRTLIHRHHSVLCHLHNNIIFWLLLQHTQTWHDHHTKNYNANM